MLDLLQKQSTSTPPFFMKLIRFINRTFFP